MLPRHSRNEHLPQAPRISIKQCPFPPSGLTPTTNTTTRTYTTTSPLHLNSSSSSNSKFIGKNLPANQFDSNATDARTDTQDTDPQSTASRDEGKPGDAHPAKQPDPQPQPESTTGIGGEEGEKGGEKGMGERSDR